MSIVDENERSLSGIFDKGDIEIEPDLLLAWLRSRRSVRRFQNRQIPKDLLNQVLGTATWAPSAHNRQPWRFVVIESSLARQSLADNMGESYRQDLHADGGSADQAARKVDRSKTLIMEAPCAVLLCFDTANCDPYPDHSRQHAEYLAGVQGAALAGGTLLLAAHAAGLAGVWMCAPLFAPRSILQSLSLPETWEPQALILLGYPKVEPKSPRFRFPLEKVVLFL